MYQVKNNRRRERSWARLKDAYPSIRYNIYEVRRERNGKPYRGRLKGRLNDIVCQKYKGCKYDRMICYGFHRALLKYDLLKKIREAQG